MWGAHLDPDFLRQDLLILYLGLYMCVPACVCYFIHLYIYLFMFMLFCYIMVSMLFL